MTTSRALYHTIADDVRARIESGQLAPGARLPAEPDLVSTYGVSKNTVRVALNLLVNEGLVVVKHGRGTFVRERPTPITTDWSTIESRAAHAAVAEAGVLDQWATLVSGLGRRPRQDVKVSIVEPPDGVARLLQLDGSRALAVLRHRIRYIDEEPYQQADSYVPAAMARGTVLEEPRDISAPGGVLASLGLVQVEYRDDIIARMPTRGEIERLKLPPATPVMEHTRTGVDKDGRALRVMVTVLPGDRHVAHYVVPAD